MKKIQSLNGLFIEQLKDRYDAANQQAAAFLKLAEACTDEELKDILQKDIEANKEHQSKLKSVFAQLGENPEGEQCEGTSGLIYEANELLGYADSDDVLNLGIAVSIQHINHHDIAGYNGCMLFAEALGKTEIQTALSDMLEDEKKTDSALSDFIAKAIIHN